MDWLKAILEKATIKDGVLSVSEVMEAVKAEIPKHFVAKADFNTKAEELKTANATIETLKKDNAGNEELQNTIKTHETTIGNLRKENEKLVKTYALKEELKKVGCSDPDYLIYKHGGLDKFAFDKDGKPVGAEQIAATYKESLAYIFPTGRKDTSYTPAGGSGSGAEKNPFAKESWNLTEQGKLLRENPEQAREMAAAAGTPI